MRTMNDPTFGPVTEGTIYDAEDPELGILSQAPEEYRFTDAMANLNLDRGVPRDQVFLSAKDSNGIPEERLIIAKEVFFLKNKVSISRQVKEKKERIACRFSESIGVRRTVT